MYIYIYMCVDYSRLPEWYIYIYTCVYQLPAHALANVVFSVCGMCSYLHSYTYVYAPIPISN